MFLAKFCARLPAKCVRWYSVRLNWRHMFPAHCHTLLTKHSICNLLVGLVYIICAVRHTKFETICYRMYYVVIYLIIIFIEHIRLRTYVIQ